MPVQLVTRTTCPHCWSAFAPEDVLWVAAHDELRGDLRLGEDAAQRFLPTRFTPEGAALDARGFPSQGLACPRCHLGIARPLLEYPPLFASIFGTPACGKSFLLAAMTWELRRAMPRDFALTFTDADPASNLILTDYERGLFLHADSDQFVPLANLIRKTELQGDLYDTVRYGDQVVHYPRPFTFTIRPTAHHKNAAATTQLGRVLCLYDNAGEHCLPGSESTATAATRHWATSAILMFLFDPTQDARIRARLKRLPDRWTGTVVNRQETVLHEAASRVRRYLGLPPSARHETRLMVILTKWDVWADQIDDEPGEPVIHSGAQSVLDLDRIERRSRKIRAWLTAVAPEVVLAAEEFCSEVIYIPASALGAQPATDPKTRQAVIRPADIRPQGVTVPLLVGLREAVKGLVSRAKRARTAWE